MTKKPVTIDDIIVSIKVRLGELDLEIHDAKKNLEGYRKPKRTYEVGYGAGYLEAVMTVLKRERKALEKIIRGEYGRKENE